MLALLPACRPDRQDNLQRHVKSEHSDRKLFCAICEKKFGTKKSLANHGKTKLHANNVIKKQRQTCKNCHASFLEWSDFEDHEAQCDTYVPYSCQQCKVSFDIKNEYDQHMLKTHNIFSCEVCGQTFDRSDKLLDHKKSLGHIKKANIRDTKPAKKHRKNAATRFQISKSRTTDNEFNRIEN